MLILVTHLMLLLQVTSPILYYDKARYDYEDKLIRGEVGLPRKHRIDPLSRTPRQETHVDNQFILSQPLNYRLPYIPTKPPAFLGPRFLNLTAAPGTTIVLPCRVVHLGPASLSWLRKPQLTVLSSGSTLFSSSPRLRLLHSSGSPDWNLQIGPLVTEDQGSYECQANTEPKLSRMVHLNVISGTELSGGHQSVPGPALALQGDLGLGRGQKTEILAPDIMKVYEGGTATLECVVTEHEVPPPYFTWYILGSPLDFTQHRGGILLQTEQKIKSSSSRLTLTRMLISDSGSYTCSPAGGSNATIYIEVKQVQPRNSFFSPDTSASMSLAVTTGQISMWILVTILV